MPEDKSSRIVSKLAQNDVDSNLTRNSGEDYYQKLVLSHRSLVDDYSRIEAKISLLESQLEKSY
ncbi:MAG: hypothetical protein LBS60_04790 [Deltaproteobacteria bacterium]|nr:hypothetical protein [Deltaproteobacteria bacterium]